MIEGFVDTRGACRMLGGISRQRLHQLASSGKLGSVFVGGRRIYRVGAIQRLLEDRGKKAGARK